MTPAASDVVADTCAKSSLVPATSGALDRMMGFSTMMYAIAMNVTTPPRISLPTVDRRAEISKKRSTAFTGSFLVAGRCRWRRRRRRGCHRHAQSGVDVEGLAVHAERGAAVDDAGLPVGTAGDRRGRCRGDGAGDGEGEGARSEQ
jgi:hypothetical protein